MANKQIVNISGEVLQSFKWKRVFYNISIQMIR